MRGCGRTCTHSAHSLISIKPLTPPVLKRRSSGCTRLGSLEACGALWPVSFVAHSHRSESSGTYLRRGSTKVLLRDVCSHHFFFTQQPCSGHPTRFTCRLTCQLYADDLVILAESEADFQAALWCHWGRFSFGVGPEKCAAMVFGPARSKLSCAVSLSGRLLEVVPSYCHSLRWDAHIAHLLAVAIGFLHEVPRGPTPKASQPPSRTNNWERSSLVTRSAGARVPRPTAVLAASLSLLQHHAARNPSDFGVGPR